jgi:hypothetical protein
MAQDNITSILLAMALLLLPVPAENFIQTANGVPVG